MPPVGFEPMIATGERPYTYASDRAAIGTGILTNHNSIFVGRVAQLVQRLATGWTVRDRIPVGVIFSAPVQKGPGAHLASCKMDTGSSRG
jgi:hypothetical protein